MFEQFGMVQTLPFCAYIGGAMNVKKMLEVGRSLHARLLINDDEN